MLLWKRIFLASGLKKSEWSTGDTASGSCLLLLDGVAPTAGPGLVRPKASKGLPNRISKILKSAC